jgi:hypothetical protein
MVYTVDNLPTIDQGVSMREDTKKFLAWRKYTARMIVLSLNRGFVPYMKGKYSRGQSKFL